MQIDIHTIATAQQRSRFPLPADIIKTLGQYCDLKSHTRVLDLACGRGELLIQWAAQSGIKGTGIDDNPDAILQAHHRADELNVWSEVQFSAVEEVAEFPQAFHQYHIVTCFEAAWITESLHTTLDLMREALRDNQRGLLVIGETFWRKTPTDEVCEALGIEQDFLPHLGELPTIFNNADTDLLEMMLIDPAAIDHHYAQQWRSLSTWLYDHETHDDASAVREWLLKSQQLYMRYEREYLGQGIFILSAMGQLTEAGDAAADEDNLSFDWQTQQPET